MTEKKIQLDLVVLIILFLTGKGGFVYDLFIIEIMQFSFHKTKANLWKYLAGLYLNRWVRISRLKNLKFYKYWAIKRKRKFMTVG